MVLGDLNDEPDAATYPDPARPAGLGDRTGGFSRPDQGDGQRLRNLAARIPERQRFSRLHRGRPQLIDHILTSSPITPWSTWSPTARSPLTGRALSRRYR